MRLRLARNLDDRFIREILEIDSLCYPKEFQGSFTSLAGRFRANRDSYITAVEGGVIIGYFCFFPVNAELLYAMKTAGSFFDDNIRPDQIAPYGRANDLFLISAAIRPDYQNGEAIRLLSRGFQNFLQNKEVMGMRVESLSCCAVSKDGERLAERLGMAKAPSNPSFRHADRKAVKNLLRRET